MTETDQQANKSNNVRNTFLAILLPFLGSIIGAFLENGYNFFCNFGIMKCKSQPNEIQIVRDELNQCNIQKDNQQSRCNDNVQKAFSTIESCHKTLLSLKSHVNNVNNNIPSFVTFGSDNSFITGQQQPRIDLRVYKSAISSFTSEIENEISKINKLNIDDFKIK